MATNRREWFIDGLMDSASRCKFSSAWTPSRNGGKRKPQGKPDPGEGGEAKPQVRRQLVNI